MEENLEEVMVQVDEELMDITEMEVQEMDLQEINTKRKDSLVPHIVKIQVVKDGNSITIFEHLKNSNIIEF